MFIHSEKPCKTVAKACIVAFCCRYTDAAAAAAVHVVVDDADDDDDLSFVVTVVNKIL